MRKSKESASRLAIERFIQPHNTLKIGLGSGSTAHIFVELLGQFLKARSQDKQSQSFCFSATSLRTEQVASEVGLAIQDLDMLSSLDLIIDGADEVDSQFRMLKGGGASLLREKITAFASCSVVTIVDESKLVDTLGKFPLVIEVVSYGWGCTLRHIRGVLQSHGIDLRESGCVLRRQDGKPYVTDNHNYLIDCHCVRIPSPEKLGRDLKQVSGVVEHGIFSHDRHYVVVGKSDGSGYILSKTNKEPDTTN